MTTKELYRKHKSGDVSNQKFLYEVRRDSNLPWITNMTSYEDAVKILKNKGIINEAEDGKQDVVVIAKTVDMVNPYEYANGLDYELGQSMVPVRCDLTEDEVLAAQKKVLKNLTDDPNYYTKLYAGLKSKDPILGPREIEVTEKSIEAVKKGPVKADGYVKKELKKDAKSNVKDNLGDSEKAPKKPKGVEELKDKGVTGSVKTIKEGIEEIIREKLAQKKANEAKVEEHHNDPNFPGGPKIHALLDKVAEDWGKDSDLYSDLEDAIVGWSNRNGELSPKGILAVKALLSNWDSLEDYEHFLTNSSDDDLAPIDRMYNSDAWVQAQKDMNESSAKKSGIEKMKEALKAALKTEKLDPVALKAAVEKGTPLHISKANTSDITAAQSAKANYTTYE